MFGYINSAFYLNLMANWKTHLVIGTTLSIGVLTILLFKGWAQLSPTIIYVPLAVFIGTLLPDIDHHNGKLRTILVGTGILLIIAGLHWSALLYVGLVLAASAFMMPYIFPHRGVMHSIPLALIYGLIVLWITNSALTGGIAGFSVWTHLLLDKIPFKIK